MTSWIYEQPAGVASLIATDGGRVFAGDAAGCFRALDQMTGELLWETDLGAQVTGYPLAGMASDFDPNGLGADVPSSDRKAFTERYTPSDDGGKLFVAYTIEDPVYLTESFTGRTQWQRFVDGTPIEPFACDAVTAAQSTSQEE